MRSFFLRAVKDGSAGLPQLCAVKSERVEKGLAADMHLHFQTCTFRHLHFRKWRHLQSFCFLFYFI